MKKYLVLFFQTFSSASAYRFQIFLTLIQGFISPALMLAALSFTIPKTHQGLSYLLPYYLTIGLIFPFVYSSIDEEMEQITTSGEVNNFLTKPISLYNWLLSKNTSEKLSHLVFLSPIFFTVFIFIKFVNGSVALGYSLEVIISTIISSLIYFNLSYLTGLVSFWVDEFWAIRNLKHVTTQLLGGFIIPLTFFPSWTVKFIKMSPFYYLASWNSTVANSGIIFSDILIALTWVIITRAVILFYQAKAISKYSFTAS